MKKIILLFVTVIPFFANAQLAKGLVFLGGSISTSLQNSDYHSQPSFSSINTTTNNNLSVSPSVGFMVSDKFALGVSIGYSSSLTKQDYQNGFPGGGISTYKSENSGYGIAPFGRYYVPLSSSAYFALQGSLSLFRGTTKTSNNGSNPLENSYYNLGLNFKPVFIFFPAPKWGVEASIGTFGYGYTRYLPDVSSTTSFGLGWGSFSFGVSYYFIKK